MGRHNGFERCSNALAVSTQPVVNLSSFHSPPGGPCSIAPWELSFFTQKKNHHSRWGGKLLENFPLLLTIAFFVGEFGVSGSQPGILFL